MIINSNQSLLDAHIELDGSFEKHKWLNVKISTGTRTLKQNAWIYKAYEMLEKQGDMTAVEYRRYCKFTFGLQILFEGDPESATRWRTMMLSVSYEDQLLSMDLMDVTSRLSPDQGARYINEIINHFSDKRLPEKNYKE